MSNAEKSLVFLPVRLGGMGLRVLVDLSLHHTPRPALKK